MPPTQESLILVEGNKIYMTFYIHVPTKPDYLLMELK